jgi:hypothetical protein
MFGSPVNTDKNTKTAVNNWRRFCDKYGIDKVLDFSGTWEERRAETTKLANFLQHESERKYGNGNRCIKSASTFTNYLFGIQRWHQQNGWIWNITYECKWTMKRLRRKYGWGHKRKLPLFLSMINDMEDLMILDKDNEEDRVVVLVMLLSVFSLMRISEILDLRVGNVKKVAGLEYKALDVKLVDSKTMQRSGKPENVMVCRRKAKRSTSWCPYKLMRERMKKLKKKGLRANDKIFNISRKVYSKRLKEAISRLGIDESRYDTHSGRIGGATMMWQAGVHPEEIKMYGRWSSDCWMYYCRRLGTTWVKLAKKIAESKLEVNDVLEDLVRE